MNLPLPLLAVIGEDERLLLNNMAKSGWSQTTIILGALALVGLLAFAFVFVFRKRLLRKRKHRHHHRHDPVTDTITHAVTVTSRDDAGNRRKRRLRRQHRPVNPTLAQTHGLPPVRDSETPPPGL